MAIHDSGIGGVPAVSKVQNLPARIPGRGAYEHDRIESGASSAHHGHDPDPHHAHAGRSFSDQAVVALPNRPAGQLPAPFGARPRFDRSGFGRGVLDQGVDERPAHAIKATLSVAVYVGATRMAQDYVGLHNPPFAAASEAYERSATLVDRPHQHLDVKI